MSGARNVAIREDANDARHDITWAVVDAVTWQRVASLWLSRESAEAAIESWRERQRKGKRPDLDLGQMVLIAVPDELVRRAEAGLGMRRQYEEAQAATFRLSERIAEERASAEAVRPLLREVVEHAVPNLVENGGINRLPDDNLWRRCWEEATRG